MPGKCPYCHDTGFVPNPSGGPQWKCARCQGNSASNDPQPMDVTEHKDVDLRVVNKFANTLPCNRPGDASAFTGIDVQCGTCSGFGINCKTCDGIGLIPNDTFVPIQGVTRSNALTSYGRTSSQRGCSNASRPRMTQAQLHRGILF